MSRAYSQDRDSVPSTWRMETLGDFYERHSPLDYLRILKDDLMKLIYSADSTKSVMSVFSSYLSRDKFSSIGREAQNLVECFRAKKSYPTALNSFGPPDKTKGKELEDWWTNYKKKKP